MLFSAIILDCRANENDTLAVKLAEVEVNAERILTNSSMKYNAYHLFDMATIDEFAPWQLSELISSVAGIHINDYGGLGGLKTVSIRGTNANQNVIMIDGIKINSAQNGITDLSILPSTHFDNVEVVKGGNSAIFGGSSIGGLINMTNSDYISDNYGMSIYAGSFDEYMLNSDVSFGNDSLNQSFFIDYKTSSGDYPFIEKNTNKELMRGENNFQYIALSSLTRIKLDEWNLSSRIILNISDRGVPGPVISDIETKSNELQDESLIYILSSSRNFDNSSLYFGLKANLNYYNYENKNSPALGSNKSEFTNRDLSFTARYNLSKYSVDWNIGTEIGFADLRGNQLDYSIGDYVKRLNLSAFLNAGSNYLITENINLDYFLGLRADYYNDINSAISGFAGSIISIKYFPASIKGQISYNFRPPSFNEMYYLNYGNTDLLPEKSISGNLGILYKSKIIDLEIDGFYISTDDQIVSVPKNPIEWSADNIGNVVSKGIEFSCSGSYFNKLLNLYLAYTLQDVRDMTTGKTNYNKLIVYTPQEILSFNTILNFNNFKTGMFMRFSNYYYSVADNSYQSMMPRYYLLDVFAEYDFKIYSLKLTLRADVKNILDKQYEVILNYPMPGRSFRAGIKYNI